MPEANQPEGKQVLAKVDVLEESIYNLLRAQEMTVRELVDCLMSEPYSLRPTDLALVVTALGRLHKKLLLGINFYVDSEGLDIKPVLRAPFVDCVPRS